jgi:hypothetical protein
MGVGEMRADGGRQWGASKAGAPLPLRRPCLASKCAAAPRGQWRGGGVPAGFIRKLGNFSSGLLGGPRRPASLRGRRPCQRASSPLARPLDAARREDQSWASLAPNERPGQFTAAEAVRWERLVRRRRRRESKVQRVR